MSGEQDKLSVSLEPPKLFGRKKKPGKTKAAPAPESTDAPAAPASATEPESRSEPEDAEREAPAEPEVAVEHEHPDDDTEVIVATSGGTRTVPADEDSPAETSVLPATDEAVDAPLMDEIHTGLPEDEDELAPQPGPTATAAPTGPSLVDRLRDRFGSQDRSEQDTAANGARPGNDAGSGTAYTAPMLDHYPAAMLTGAIVGLGMVTLTWLSLRGCEAIRGTASCGGGPGFLLLVATFVISVMLGSAILKSFDVPDPGSSSFLAVGLVAVVALLLLIDVLDHWSMLLVVPVVAVGAYLLSVYITKTFVEPEG